MSQFDVHRTRGEAARLTPFLVVLQSDLLAALNTVIVAPMRPGLAAERPVNRLQVRMDFDGAPHVVAADEMASIPRSALGARAGSIADARQDLMAAVDLLFIGF